jgi:hypothetical protein
MDYYVYPTKCTIEAATVANIPDEPTHTRVIVQLISKLVLFEFISRQDSDTARFQVVKGVFDK